MLPSLPQLVFVKKTGCQKIKDREENYAFGDISCFGFFFIQFQCYQTLNTKKQIHFREIANRKNGCKNVFWPWKMAKSCF